MYNVMGSERYREKQLSGCDYKISLNWWCSSDLSHLVSLKLLVRRTPPPAESILAILQSSVVVMVEVLTFYDDPRRGTDQKGTLLEHVPHASHMSVFPPNNNSNHLRDRQQLEFFSLDICDCVGALDIRVVWECAMFEGNSQFVKKRAQNLASQPAERDPGISAVAVHRAALTVGTAHGE